MNRSKIIWAVVLGIIFLIIAAVYWIVPANALPHFFPGYDASMATVHVKHGLLSFILAVLLFVYAWFAGAPKKV